jgi:hypothetical protein
MVTIEFPDGSRRRYALVKGHDGSLRIEGECASYDLLAVLRAGWQVIETEPAGLLTTLLYPLHDVAPGSQKRTNVLRIRLQ